MKISSSIKKRCKECKLFYRNGKLNRSCIIAKHKAHQ